MSYTENLIRATDFAVFLKGLRGEWIAYPEGGKIYSTLTGDFLTLDSTWEPFFHNLAMSWWMTLFLLCRGIVVEECQFLDLIPVLCMFAASPFLFSAETQLESRRPLSGVHSPPTQDPSACFLSC